MASSGQAKILGYKETSRPRKSFLATMIFFCYSPHKTLLHRVPPLAKLIAIGICSYLVFQVNQTALLFTAAVLLLGKLCWQIRNWRQISVFFCTIFTLSTFFNLDYQQLSIEQLRSPFFYTLRLSIVLLLNIFFVFSTTPYQIAQSISQLFWFYPTLQKKVFLLIFLIFSLIPIIFQKKSQLDIAQRSRIFRLNPLKKIIYKIFPLLIICIDTADKLSKAIESRS